MFQDIQDNYRGPIEIEWFWKNKEKIDFSPENYQRCFVWKEKQQRELLRTIFDSNPGVVPELHLRNYTNPINTRKKPGIIAEVMDGQQRLTTIMRFMENKIKTPDNLEFMESDGTVINISGKYRNELPQVVEDFLLLYKLQVCFCTDIQDEEAAIIFNKKLNSGKPLTKSEKRNAFTTQVASFIRNTARLGEKHRHPLFKTKIVDENVEFEYFDSKMFKYENYDADGITSVVCALLDKASKYAPCNEQDLNKLYKSEKYKIRFAHEIAAKSILDVLEKIVTSTIGQQNKKLWKISLLEHLVRVIMHFRDEKIEIEFPEKFTKKYVEKTLEFSKPDSSEQAKGAKNSYYSRCIVKQNSKDAISYCVNLMTNAITDYSEWGLKLKNSDKRKFNDTEKLEALNRQNFICPMCNESMSLENTHGGHIVPFSSGGTTTSDNLVALHAHCNLKLGSRDLNEWIKENVSSSK